MHASLGRASCSRCMMGQCLHAIGLSGYPPQPELCPQAFAFNPTRLLFPYVGVLYDLAQCFGCFRARPCLSQTWPLLPLP
jgi:hypothetical protein